MPFDTIWVKPEVFLTHNGVNVYTTYKDHWIDQPNNYLYTTDKHYGRGPNHQTRFDVRLLPAPKASGKTTYDELLPPYIQLNDPPEREEELRKLWADWHMGEEALHRTMICEAIDTGIIKATPLDPDYDSEPTAEPIHGSAPSDKQE